MYFTHKFSWNVTQIEGASKLINPMLSFFLWVIHCFETMEETFLK